MWKIWEKKVDAIKELEKKQKAVIEFFSSDKGRKVLKESLGEQIIITIKNPVLYLINVMCGMQSVWQWFPKLLSQSLLGNKIVYLPAKEKWMW